LNNINVFYMTLSEKPKPEKRRRIPVQARSIERVNKILDTASKLMAKRLDEKISTHLIAREAGVSVGSVYQFFPNVESLSLFRAVVQKNSTRLTRL